MTPPLGMSLEDPAPAITLQQAAQLAERHFGLTGSVSPLTGERDRNFRIGGADGRAWVLKVGHPGELDGLSDLQRHVLLWAVAADPELPIPRVHEAVDGSAEILWVPPSEPDATPSRVRVYSYVPGIPLHRVPPSARLRGELGALLGRLDRALVGFEHPAARHDLIWDASRVDRIADLVEPDDALVRAALDHLREHLAPSLRGVRHQVIHNDANPHNVMVEPDGRHVVGLIDFGDVIWAPVTQDLATASAYQLADGQDGLEACIDLVRGYHSQHPLTGTELGTVFDLMLARLVLVVVITGQRARRHPRNRDYILRNHRRARLGLERAMSIDHAEATAALHRAVEETA